MVLPTAYLNSSLKKVVWDPCCKAFSCTHITRLGAIHDSRFVHCTQTEILFATSVRNHKIY